MVQILRQWRVHAYLDLLLLTRDLRQTLIWSGSDAIESVAAITGILLLVERFNGIGVWSKYQVLFLLAFAAVSMGLAGTLFGYNVMWISRRVGRGQLDHTLIQPQPIWRAFLTEGIMPVTGLFTLVPTGAFLVWAACHLPIAISPIWLALFTVDLLASMAAAVAFSFLCGSLAFWAPVGAEEISMSALNLVSDLKSFPLDGAGRALRCGLIMAVPVGLVAWLPCRYLVGLEPLGPRVLIVPMAAAAFCTVAAIAFRKGMQHYGYTGSSRYTSFGHRR